MGEGIGAICKAPAIVFASACMREIIELVDTVAQSDCSVIVEGESGVGKELIARRLHAMSGRSEGPFIPVNCASVSETLFDSQFFGHVRGAFTGAVESMLGLVRSANGGVLFMDEVGEIPLHLQPKLLRVLQDGEVMAVGATRPEQVDTRFVAATNRELRREVEEGRFRKDLFYRLNVVNIVIPPLRDRREDVSTLLDHFLAAGALGHRVPKLSVETSVREQLCRYNWPGNVRELACWVNRLYATRLPAARLVKDMLRETASTPPATPSGPISMAQAEKQAIQAAMMATGNNRAEAARLLDIHKTTLYRKLEEFSLA